MRLDRQVGRRVMATMAALLLLTGCGGDDGAGDGGGAANVDAPRSTPSAASDGGPDDATDASRSTPPAAVDAGPDAVYVLSAPDGPWTLSRLVEDGGTEAVPIPVGADIESPDVSPDGSMVAYVATGTDPVGVWITDLEPAGAPRPLWARHGAGCPRWFPDGRRLAVLADDQVFVLDATSGEARAVGPRTRGLALSCADPIDDETLAVAVTPSEDEWRTELSVLTIQDGALEVVGAGPDRCILNSPAVAPDGAEVAVAAICEDGSRNGLYLVDLDGGDLTTVLAENPPETPQDLAHQYWDPAWTSAGRAIVYHRSSPAERASVRSVTRTGRNDHEIAPALTCCPAVGPSPPMAEVDGSASGPG